MRTLLALVVGCATFLGSLILLGSIGVTAVHFQIPISLFVAALALWPVLGTRLIRNRGAFPFREWVGYQASVMIVMMILIYGVNRFIETQRVIESLR